MTPKPTLFLLAIEHICGYIPELIQAEKCFYSLVKCHIFPYKWNEPEGISSACHAQLIKQSTCMSKTHKTDAENILGELTKNIRQFFQCQCYLFHAEVDKKFILFWSLRFQHLALNVLSSLVYSASKTLIVIGWGDLSSLMLWNTIKKLFFKSKYIVFIFIKLFQR